MTDNVETAGLGFDVLAGGHTPEDIHRLAEEVASIARTSDARKANDFFFKKVGVRCSPGRSEPHLSEALHYNLGHLYAFADLPEEMAKHVALSRTLPGTESALIFSDHVSQSLAVRAAQLKGIAQGMPPILIACMPRSASSTLVQTLARFMEIPFLQLCIGCFPRHYLVPSWTASFFEGGAINHDHLSAGDFNIGVLGKSGVRDVFVLARDPRAAARSIAHARSMPYLAAHHHSKSVEQLIEEKCVLSLIPWLQGWMERAKDPALPFRIHFTTYADVCRDPAGILRKMSGILQDRFPQMARYENVSSLPLVLSHFVAGDDDAWKKEVSEETRDRLWSACTPEVKTLLQLQR